MPSSVRRRTGGTGTSSGSSSSLRLLAAHGPRRTLADRLCGPGTILAGLGGVVALGRARVPAPDRPEAPPAARAVERRVHRVAEGDTLRDLARQYYDDPSQWRQIFLANREKLVRDGRLVPGDQIVIPVFDVGQGAGGD